MVALALDFADSINPLATEDDALAIWVEYCYQCDLDIETGLPL